MVRRTTLFAKSPTTVLLASPLPQPGQTVVFPQWPEPELNAEVTVSVIFPSEGKSCVSFECPHHGVAR